MTSHNKIPSNNTVIGIVSLLILISFLSSCYTQKQAVKDVNKANQKFPDTVAALTRGWYPCIVTASDTIVRIDTTYDFIEVECPEYDINQPRTPGKIDTIYKDKPPVNYLISTRVPIGTRPVMVGLNKYPQTTTIVEKVEDSAKIFVMQRQMSVCNTTNAELESSLKGAKKFNLYLIIAFVISVLFNVIQFIRRR